MTVAELSERSKSDGSLATYPIFVSATAATRQIVLRISGHRCLLRVRGEGRCRGRDVPAGRVVTSAIPNVPFAETNVVPVGKGSKNVGLKIVVAPTLTTVNVYVSFAPCTAVAGPVPLIVRRRKVGPPLPVAVSGAENSDVSPVASGRGGRRRSLPPCDGVRQGLLNARHAGAVRQDRHGPEIHLIFRLAAWCRGPCSRRTGSCTSSSLPR